MQRRERQQAQNDYARKLEHSKRKLFEEHQQEEWRKERLADALRPSRGTGVRRGPSGRCLRGYGTVVCQFCGTVFVDKYGLQKHTRKYHSLL